MRFGVLGPVDVTAGTGQVAIGGQRSRCLLAALLLDANRVVPIDRLIDAAWGSAPPAGARVQVRNRISGLRRVLRAAGADVTLIATRGSGYHLTLEVEQLDLLRFEAGVAAAERAVVHDLDEARRLLADALALWRGPALDGLPTEILRIAAEQLEERRLATLERRIELELVAGRHAELVAELTMLAGAHPYREGLHSALMTALYRCGRQAEALEAYHRARLILVDQLGIEPGWDLRRIHEAVLRGSEELLRPPTRITIPDATRSDGTAAAADDGYLPPTSAVPDVPRTLPAETGAFVGRHDDQAALDDALRYALDTGTYGGCVGITGPPGAGKTALAVHWGHRAADHFPGGQLYLDLRCHATLPPLRPIDALGILLRALNVRANQIPESLAEASALYRSVLAGQRVLVLLDNACSAEHVRPLLPAGAGCFAVVTSRNRLAGLVATEGARTITLDSLNPDEARELLVGVLGRERIAAEPTATEELARRCGHLPLALRIAAANLHVRPHHRLGDYVARLGQGDVLDALTVTDGVEHNPVRTAFQFSYRLIPAAAQRLFRLLGLMPGPDISVAGAAALADLGVERTAALLDQLAAAHLVLETAPDRYGMHDLLKRYATERDAPDGVADERSDALRRLHLWYLHSLHSAVDLRYPQVCRLPLPGDHPAARRFTCPADAMRWLALEHQNILGCIQQASATGSEAAWLLADGLRSYLWQQGLIRDQLVAAQAGLRAAEAADAPSGQAAMRLSLGQVNHHNCHYQEAADHLTEAVRLSVRAGWREGQLAAVTNLGTVQAHLGALESAVAHHLHGLELCADDDLRRASLLNNLGIDYRLQGRLHDAVQALEASLRIYERITAGTSGQAATLESLGAAYHELGALTEARALSGESLSLAQAGGHRAVELAALIGLATIHADLADHTQALAYAETALRLAESSADRGMAAEARLALATAYRGLGDRAAALKQYEVATSIAESIGLPGTRIKAMTGLASAQGPGRSEFASRVAQSALNLAVRTGFDILAGQALTTLGEIHLRAGHHALAAEYGHRAGHLHRKTGHRPGEVRAAAVLAEVNAAGTRRSRLQRSARR